MSSNDIAEVLSQIDTAMAAVRAGKKRRVFTGATPESLARLASTMRQPSEELAAWFRWHDGLPELFPRLSARALSIDEAIAARSNYGAVFGSEDFLVLTDHGGGRCDVYLSRADAGQVVYSDRGSVGPCVPFAEWVKRILDEWRAQANRLEADFVRFSKNMITGSTEVTLPAKLRKKLAASLGRLETQCRVGDRLVFVRADVSRWERSESELATQLLTIGLSAVDLEMLRSSVAGTKDTVRVGELHDLRLIFSDR